MGGGREDEKTQKKARIIASFRDKKLKTLTSSPKLILGAFHANSMKQEFLSLVIFRSPLHFFPLLKIIIAIIMFMSYFVAK